MGSPVQYHTTHHMVPYDVQSYGTIWRIIHYCTDTLYATVRCTMVWNCMTHRTILYDESYGTVQRTIQHAVQYHMTHYHTEPYYTKWESYANEQRVICYRMMHHGMELYDPLYNTVRWVIWYHTTHHTTRCTVPYDTLSYGTILYRMRIVR